MLSRNGFRIAFALSISPMSLHDLRRTMIFEGIEGRERDRMLLEGLADLCRSGLLVWSFEPDYGNKPATKPLDCCHRAVQNQPLVGGSKPASLRRGFHNRYGCWIKGFGSRINEPGTAASPSSRPRRWAVPSTWRFSPLAGMATASP